METQKQSKEIVLVDVGAKVFIGEPVKSESFTKEDGYFVLKNVRTIQGQMIPVNSSVVRFAPGGKPLADNSNMVMGFIMLPYPTDGIVLLEDNIFGFTPVSPGTDLFKMYEEQLKYNK